MLPALVLAHSYPPFKTQTKSYLHQKPSLTLRYVTLIGVWFGVFFPAFLPPTDTPQNPAGQGLVLTISVPRVWHCVWYRVGVPERWNEPELKCIFCWSINPAVRDDSPDKDEEPEVKANHHHFNNPLRDLWRKFLSWIMEGICLYF